MRALLIDADIIVHRMAHVNQQAMEWDANTWSYFGDFGRAKAQFVTWLDDLMDKLWGDEVRLFLSDSEANWRHGLMPGYKGHRASWQAVALLEHGQLPADPGPQRPMLYKPLRRWLLEERQAIMEPSLEADDLLGLFGTAPLRTDDERPVIVTVDKDLRTVPGLHYNPDKPEDGVTTVTQEEADYTHFYLTLVGDTSDGYKGCPGVGPVKAKQLLAHSPTWTTVVQAYEKAGLTEADALQQARVSRVLQTGDFNFTTKEIRLWNPTT